MAIVGVGVRVTAAAFRGAATGRVRQAKEPAAVGERRVRHGAPPTKAAAAGRRTVAMVQVAGGDGGRGKIGAKVKGKKRGCTIRR